MKNSDFSTSGDPEDWEEVDLPEITPTSSSEQPSIPTTAPVPVAVRIPRKLQPKPEKCAVCGSRADGHHYRAPACYDCEIFFRSVYRAPSRPPCEKNNNCFDLKLRSRAIKCVSCRYQKCISIGINSFAIGLIETVEQVEYFERPSKRPSKRCKNQEDHQECRPIAKMLFTKENENNIERTIDMLTYLEFKLEAFRKSAYNPDWHFLPGLLGLIEESNKMSIAINAGPMPGWPLAQQDILKGNESGPKPKSRAYDPLKKMWLLYDLLTTVEYAKTFEFFHKLDMQDRVLLLKYVSLACMNLHISYYSISHKFDRVIHPDGTIAPHIHGMVYAETTMSIAPLLRYDVKATEYILLKAVCLCNPAVSGLSQNAQNLLTKERKKLASVLLAYCMRDPKLGASHFAHLIGIIDTLEHQQKIQKDLHLLLVLPTLKMKKNERMRLIDDIMEN